MEEVYGGPMPAGCIYAPPTWSSKNPNTAQAVVNAMVRAANGCARRASTTSSRRCRRYLLRRPRASTATRSSRRRKAFRRTARFRGGSQNVHKVLATVRARAGRSEDRPARPLDEQLRRKASAEVSRAEARRSHDTKPGLRRRRSRSTNITCTFAAQRDRAQRYTAVRDTTLAVGARRVRLGRRADRLRQDRRCSTSRAGLLAPSAAAVRVFGEPLVGHQPQGRLHVPGRRADAVASARSTMSRPASLSRHGRSAQAREQARAGSRASASAASATAIRTSSPAACASASRSRRR